MEKLSIIPNEREIIEKLKENYNKNVKESSNILFSYDFLLKQTKIDILPKINVKQIYLYKTFSNYFDDNNLKYINKFNFIMNKYNSDNIFNYFLLHIFHFFEKHYSIKNKKIQYPIIYNSFNYLISIFSKLYHNKILKLNHLEIISRLILFFSIIPDNEKYINKEEIYNDKIIKNIMFIPLSLNLIKFTFMNKKIKINKEEENSIINYFEFFFELLIENNIPNKNILMRYDSKVFNIIEYINLISSENNKLSKTLENILIELYINNFSIDGLMIQFIKITKNSLINFDQKNLSVLKQKLLNHYFIINYLINTSNKEKKLFSLDSYKLNEGFYLGSETAGINVIIDKFQNKENTILFSFNLIPSQHLINYSIITCQKENEIFFEIKLIKGNNSNYYYLCIEIKDFQIKTNIRIVAEKTHLFALSFFDKKKLSISFIGGQYNHFITNEYNYKEGIDFSNFNFCVGCKLIYYTYENSYIYINSFSGFIGPLIVFNLPYSKRENFEKLKYIFQLKGNYSDFLYKDYMLDNILIYERNNSNYENIIKSNIKDLEKDIELYIYPQSFKNKYIDNIDYLRLNNGKKIILLNEHKKILPNNLEKKKSTPVKKSFFFNPSIQINLKYDKEYILGNENIANIKNKFHKNRLLEIYKNFNSKFFPFKSKDSISEFLKIDGIKFLTLHLEFYYQIIKKEFEKKDTSINNYENNINELIDLM